MFVFDGNELFFQVKNDNTGTALYTHMELLKLTPHFIWSSLSCVLAVLAVWHFTIVNFSANICSL